MLNEQMALTMDIWKYITASCTLGGLITICYITINTRYTKSFLCVHGNGSSLLDLVNVSQQMSYTDQEDFRSDEGPNYCVPKQQNNLYMSIHCLGRMGNRMFQYAVLFGRSCKDEYWTPILPTQFESRFAEAFQHISIKITNITLINSTRALLTNRNVTLPGLPPSARYFSHVEMELREEFKFKGYIIDTVKHFL